MTRLDAVLARIDERNAADPVVEYDPASGEQRPRALLYGRRMSDRLATFAPRANGLLRIAARGQHIERWIIPRADYPSGRRGYLRWRRELGAYHGAQVAGIMANAGYGDADSERVASMLRKEDLKRDPDVQTLEDVAAQVFLLHYLPGFVTAHGAAQGETKLYSIVRKTWRKMSPGGRDAALQLPIDPDVLPVVESALGAGGDTGSPA